VVWGRNGDGRGLRSEAFSYHASDLRPKAGIALALHVAGSEDSLPPGGFGAFDRSLFVIDAVVPEDLSACGIGGSDLATAVENARGLIKIYGLGNVIGNDRVVLPPLGDTIHLHRQRNGNALLSEITGQ